MKHLFILLFTACTLLTYAQVPEGYPANYAKAPRFKALIYYTQHAEEAHVQFAEQATTFFKKLNYGDGFVLDITTDFSKYPYEKLKEYNVIIMLNTSFHRSNLSLFLPVIRRTSFAISMLLHLHRYTHNSTPRMPAPTECCGER